MTKVLAVTASRVVTNKVDMAVISSKVVMEDSTSSRVVMEVRSDSICVCLYQEGNLKHDRLLTLERLDFGRV